MIVTDELRDYIRAMIEHRNAQMRAHSQAYREFMLDLRRERSRRRLTVTTLQAVPL